MLKDWSITNGLVTHGRAAGEEDTGNLKCASDSKRRLEKSPLDLLHCVNCGKLSNGEVFLLHPYRKREVLCRKCANSNACQCCETRKDVIFCGYHSMCKPCKALGTISYVDIPTVKCQVLRFLKTLAHQDEVALLEDIEIYLRREMMSPITTSGAHTSKGLQTYGVCSCVTNSKKRKVNYVAVTPDLPEVLFAFFLCHEYVHAFMHLTGSPKDNEDLEETLCRYVSLLYLAKEKKIRLSSLEKQGNRHVRSFLQQELELIDFWKKKLTSKSRFGNEFLKVIHTLKKRGLRYALS